MRVDWCVSSWFRIKDTHSHPTNRPGHGRHKQGSKAPSLARLIQHSLTHSRGLGLALALGLGLGSESSSRCAAPKNGPLRVGMEEPAVR